MKKSILILLLVLGLISSSQAQQVEIKDGIRYIYNKSPLWDDKPKIGLEFVRKIGELEGENENLHFFNPYSITVDKTGNAYVCDSGNHRIQKFDKTGKYLLTIGKRGQGPGEFYHPYNVHINSAGEVLVENSGSKIIVFDQNGKYLRMFSISEKDSNKKPGKNRPVMSITGTLKMLDNDLFALKGRSRLFLDEMEDHYKSFSKQPLFIVYNEEGTIIGKYGNKRSFSDREKTKHLNDFYLTIDSRGNYYAAWEAKNCIEKFAPNGAVLFRSSRKLKYSESNEVKHLSLGRSYAPQYNMFSNKIECDGKNRLWVETYLRQFTDEERKKSYRSLETPNFTCMEVYDNNGILLQRIQWEYGKGRRLIHISGKRVFFISWNDMCVYEYKITDIS